MTTAKEDVAWSGRSWQIVRADLDLAHVFLSLSSFTFEPTTKNGVSGYTISHTGQAPAPDCFSEVFLVPLGSHKPTFREITDKDDLPLFSKDTATEYSDVSDKVASYMDQNREVQRLEGVVKIPCHAHGAQLPATVMADHPPMWIKTLLHVYQFGNVVKGDRPLILFRAPLSPVCPVNGDGSAIGYA
jgi:hypothetical protein